MGAPPFRTFHGYLKQHAHEHLSSLEQELFDLLFPAFQGTSDGEEAYQQFKNYYQGSLLSSLIKFLPGERTSRRFAGFDLPRRRYFGVCTNARGSDGQTLAHEFRAYRNPVALGMIEAIDLAEGCTIKVHDAKISIEPQPALAVLIHQPQDLPSKFLALNFKKVPGLNDQPIFIYQFPYQVTLNTIERVIDLRFQDVQSWFYKTFRIPSELSKAYENQSTAMTDAPPTTARSRFHFENKLPPIPESFWSMLPTLMNPDLGGGPPEDTGSTLLMIGHWMRQEQVSALIFPSARCDVTTIFEKGVLKHWHGWNLLDFRDAPLFEMPAKAITMVTSPWAWVSLPTGAKLKIASKNSTMAGSFEVENMVRYWSLDYHYQLQALKVARSIHGREQLHYSSHKPHNGIAFRALQIGTLSSRWLWMTIQNSPTEKIDNIILELQGLAIPLDLYPITGRVSELWDTVKRGSTPLNQLIPSVITVTSLLVRFLKDHYPGQELDKLVQIGADIEFSLFLLGAQKQTDTTAQSSSFSPSGFITDINKVLVTHWIDTALRTEIRDFHQRVISSFSSLTTDQDQHIEEGIRIQRDVYKHLRRQHDTD